MCVCVCVCMCVRVCVCMCVCVCVGSDEKGFELSVEVYLLLQVSRFSLFS